jgi:Raf kinase inhibitor-like YbhB/YbcL family protein
MALTLRSPAFADGGAIPKAYTCEGADRSPPLEFAGVPAGAKSLALVVDDPDAPDPAAPRMVFVHWVLWDMPAGAAGLAEGVGPKDLPAGTQVGKTDYRKTAWGGPCPPIGRHRYFFKLYALDTALGPLRDGTKAGLLAAMKGHVLEEAQLMGTYQKAG